MKEFSDLADLKRFTPPEEQVHPSTASKMIPMLALFKDEKYVAERSRHSLWMMPHLMEVPR